MNFRQQLHPSWQEVLEPQLSYLDEVQSRISKEDFLPQSNLVMRALSHDFSKCKVLILGQDPYPNANHANGLAFSVPSHVEKLPASLKNIYKELNSDLGLPAPTHGDLSSWAEQGVVLLNRTLTCRKGESNSHLHVGWDLFTEACVKSLADSGCVAILWGNNAQELAHYFNEDRLITSVHPSPLSAYRGFFGSKPFSRANAALIGLGDKPIDWSL
ncbi:MAG: uracil-DNA glycosylase [Actinomycetota bacterium]